MLARLLTRTHHLRRLQPRLHHKYSPALRVMSSAALSAVESTAQPASNPAIQKAGGAKKPKEKKGDAAAASHALEVRVRIILAFND